MISQTSNSQSAVPRSATSALTGSWLEMQITSPSPGQLNQKLWDGTQQSVVYGALQLIQMHPEV